MANINLLPWRAQRRKIRQREFYMGLLATTIAAFAVVFLGILWMGHLIDVQNERNAYMQDQIKALDAKIVEIAELDKTRSQLLTRKEIIEQLQSNRSQMVHLFDDMVKTIPDGARLTGMKQAGDTLTLEGVAESNSRVASYMRAIDAAPWMGHTDLRKIENKSAGSDADKKMPYVFSLDVKLHKPEAADADKDAAQASPDGDNADKGAAASTGDVKPAPAPATEAKPATSTPAAPAKPAPAAAVPPPKPTPAPAAGEKK